MPRPRMSQFVIGPAADDLGALASTMRLTMPNRSKVLRAARSMPVTVTTSPGSRPSSVGRSFRSGPAPVHWGVLVPARAVGCTVH
jgi:hypothetical protein